MTHHKNQLSSSKLKTLILKEEIGWKQKWIAWVSKTFLCEKFFRAVLFFRRLLAGLLPWTSGFKTRPIWDLWWIKSYPKGFPPSIFSFSASESSCQCFTNIQLIYNSDCKTKVSLNKTFANIFSFTPINIWDGSTPEPSTNTFVFPNIWFVGVQLLRVDRRRTVFYNFSLRMR
jgi:hypothetical protein